MIDSVERPQVSCAQLLPLPESARAPIPDRSPSQSPTFLRIGRDDLAAFADLTRERGYPKGSVIVFEDDPGDALYLVAAGQVKVVLIAEDGREVILSVLGEGNFFGEMAVIDEEPRSAHVIAMEDSSLLVLRRDDFQPGFAPIRRSPSRS